MTSGSKEGCGAIGRCKREQERVRALPSAVMHEIDTTPSIAITGAGKIDYGLE